jgi:DeoR family transcriptional regulator, suf operon transcriptional repressor
VSTTAQISDRSLIDHLRKRPGATISDFVATFGVTATAVRQRLTRLMDQGLVQRRAQTEGRGRPTHKYELSPSGMKAGGDNYQPLATALWEEIRGIDDPQVKRGLLARLAKRMAEAGASEVSGRTLQERMESLADWMQRSDIPFEVNQEGGLPILTALACPYPDLAEQDRGVCAMEKMMFAEVLGTDVRLSACRLDGASCCTFETSQGVTQAKG